MTQPTEFEKKIRPTIDAFVADLKKLIIHLVEEAVLHDGLDSLKKPKQRKGTGKPKKPVVIHCGGNPNFRATTREVLRSKDQWTSLALARQLNLGETTVRGYLKKLVALGVVERIEFGNSGRLVKYARKPGRFTLR